MRNANKWLRSVLGLSAVLLVAGPGMVLAVYDPSYTPRSIVVNGPGTLTVGGSGQYTATVTFTNGQTATTPAVPGVTFSALNGNITVTPNATGATATGVSPGISAVRATFTQQGATVTGTRIVRVQ